LLQADAFEQLAWRAESGVWRDVYLMGAQELRQGTLNAEVFRRPNPDVASGLSTQQIFDYLAIKIDGEKAAKLGHIFLNWILPDIEETIRIELSNGTLHASPGLIHDAPHAVVTCSRKQLNHMVSSGDSISDLVELNEASIEGDADLVFSLWETFTDFPLLFNIIEP